MPTGSEVAAPSAIRLDSVSVHYETHETPSSTLKELMIRWSKRDLKKSYVRALDELSLDVGKGEVFGIIGRNGAGKSTLLRVVSGILSPTAGRVRVWGSVTGLLGIGAGFHGDLTGRENIYLYSAILGRSAERTGKLVDGIVDFAELRDFIDSPLRVYSTGMSARLGFAVALAEAPDVLLVDEVLGVGDEQFRLKCQRRFSDVRERGTTILIVTHSMTVAREMCDRAAWLANGQVQACGDSADVAAEYQEFQKRARDGNTVRDPRS